MAATGYTPISLYYSTTASAVPTAGNLVAGELAININDGKLYFKNSSNVVTLLASSSGASGDVVGPASATDNAIARFDGTTGKLIQNSAVTIDDTTGSLTFTGSAARILGDFSNATVANRVFFQNSTAATTWLGVLPGTGSTQSQAAVYNNADPTNAAYLRTLITSAETRLDSNITGTGTYLPLTMYTGGSERLRIDTSGNVGIGTSSPAYKLDVSGVISNGSLRLNSNEIDGVAVNTDLYIGYRDIRDIYFYTGGTGVGTQRMIINTSGNVGIGTTAPQAVLDLGTGTSGRGLTWGGNAGANRYASIFAPFSNGGIVLGASFYGSASADSYLSSYTGTTYANGIRLNVFDAAGIQFFTDGSASKTAGAAFTPTERMRITSTGNVGIGLTSPTYQLDVFTSGNNGIRLYAGTSSADQLYMGNTGGLPAFGTLTNQVVRFITNGTERARIDTSGNLGLGVTPSSSWWGNLRVLQVGYGASLAGGNGLYATLMYLGANYYTDGTNNRYLQSDFASRYDQVSGTHKWFTAPSGTAGNTITFTQAMTLDASGNLGINVTSPETRLDVNGIVTVRNNGGTFNTTPNTNYGLNFQATNSGDTYITSYSSGGSTTLAFATNSGGGAASERMRINSSGNVGIGTSSPAFPLDIAGATGVTRVTSTTGTNAVYSYLTNTGGDFYIGRDNSAGSAFTSSAYASVLYSVGAYPMVFFTNATERLRIDSSGNALFAKAVRATITTDNDLSFDMNAASNFKCTPTAGGALTFTNITSGQTGNIILVNNSNYAITAAATTKVSSTCLATISATGTYWLSYYSDGTNVYVANTGALA